MKKRITRVIVITCFVLLIIPQAVFADSSWCWLTDTRPFDILPPVALATIVIEVLAIWLIPHTGKLMKTAVAVILANAASFLLPYALLLNDPVYPKFDDMLNAGPNYIVGAGFVILTLVLEIPIVYNLLKKHVDSKKKLLWSIIGSNIVTTAMVAVIERMVTDGYWV
ncbi:MAG: hypothetical protein PUK13_00540 [Clostridiales bacterium]|nr:hypothetical protein [Clostridiales bacterium]